MNELPPLTIGVVKRIRDATGVDLLGVGRPEVDVRLWGDDVFMVKAVSVVTSGGGATDGLAGDRLAKVAADFRQRLIEFYPKTSTVDAAPAENPKETSVADLWRGVYKAAGVVGVVPDGLSIRELFWMADGAYEPWAISIANFVNAHAGKGARTVKPDDLNPYSRRRTLRTRAQQRKEQAP